MNQSKNCSSANFDETSSDEDGKLKLQLAPQKVCAETEKTYFLETQKKEMVIPVSESKKISMDHSEYLICHPPKYTLPPYLDPKSANLSLRDQVKVICSYHAVISKSIANQAKIQIDSCSYPEPIDPIQKKNISLSQKKEESVNEDQKEADGSGDKFEEYVSRAGRITKRKFYSEVDHRKKVRIHKTECTVPATESSLQDSIASPKGNGDDEVPTKRKAPLPPSRNKNLRQRLKLDTPEADTESKMKNNSKGSSPNTLQKQQKRSSDGFVEPAVPGSNKRTIRKTIECPICSKHYPEKEIEQHASSCGEIPMDVGSTNHPNVTRFRCHSCKKVLISDEDYDIHCTTCNGGPSYLN